MAPQLSLEFETSVRPVRMSGIHMKPSEALYHGESSKIDNSRFALKFEYKSRSYMITGAYHLTSTTAFRDESLEKTVDFIAIDQILSYRNGQYIITPVLRSDEQALDRAARKIISDPFTNPYLTLVHERTFA